MSVQLNLQGRTALVTGSGRGAGRATAMLLAQAGARIAVMDITASAAQETRELIRAAGGEAEAFSADVTDIAAVNGLCDSVRAKLGVTDIIVNNIGWTSDEPFLKNSIDDIHKLIAVNYTGTLYVCQTFLADLVEAQLPGRVVNTASGAARLGNAGQAVYAGAKGGVIAFTKSLAREMARHKINVNCIAPGAIETPLLRAQSEKMLDYFRQAIPLRRFAQPEDIAAATCFLVSDLSAYITGQVLSVDGGLTMAG